MDPKRLFNHYLYLNVFVLIGPSKSKRLATIQDHPNHNMSDSHIGMDHTAMDDDVHPTICQFCPLDEIWKT